MKTAQEIESTLPQFIGSQTLTPHWTGRLFMTEGVMYLAEAAGAHWLTDVVASYQGKPVRKCEGFQIWELVVKDHIAVVTCRRDTGEKPVVTQDIEYTDFPLDSIKLYVVDDVLILPGEY